MLRRHFLVALPLCGAPWVHAQGKSLTALKFTLDFRVNGQTGELTLRVDDAELAARQPHIPDLSGSRVGTGREMFGALREKLSGAEQGATCITF